MPPSISDGTLILKKMMTRVAFAHLTNVDARTGLDLSLRGLIDGSESALDSSAIEIAVDSQHRLRNEATAGPIVFYRDEDESNNQFALDMSQVLLSDHDASRAAALLHFRDLAKVGGLVTARTRSAIDAAAQDMASQDRNVWGPAALGIYDLIVDDLFCVSAGARQSIEQRYEEGMQEYFPRLLRPAIAAINGLDVDLITSQRPIEKGEEIIEQIVRSSKSLDSACAEYVERVGFLPLTGVSAFSELMRKWKDVRGEADGVWKALRRWIESSGSALPRFYTGAYFLEPGIVAPEDEEYWWSVAMNVIDAPQEDGLRNVSIWKLRAELTRHFLQYLDVRLPGLEGDGIPRAAMWLAERVTALIGMDSSTIAKFRNTGIVSECYESEFNWRVANPPPNRSPLSVAILGQAEIWAHSLLSRLTVESVDSLLARRNEADRDTVERAFTVLCLRKYAGNSTDSAAVYAFEMPIEPSIEVWTNAVGETERMKFVATVNAARQRLFDPAEFEKAFRSLSEDNSEADQLLIANTFEVMVKQGKAKLDPAWTILCDPNWRRGAFAKLHEATLEVLFTAFSESLYSVEPRFWIELPHIFAKACEDEELAKVEGRRELLFGWMLLASVHTYSASAVDRLLTRQTGAAFLDLANIWRRVFSERIPNAAPWVTARLRAALSSLSPAWRCRNNSKTARNAPSACLSRKFLDPTDCQLPVG